MTNAVYITNFTTLDDPSAGSSGGTQALGINDNGEIVGGYVDANGVENGFVYNAGSYQTLDEPNSVATTLVGINASGEIVGHAQGASNSFGDAFYYDNGVFTNIKYQPDTQLFTTTSIAGINNAGVIVGSYDIFYDLPSGNPSYGFMYSDDEFVALNGPAGAINTLNQIVGEYVSEAGDSGFLYENSQYTNLPITIANTHLPLTLSLTGINDSGEIVGTYLDADNNFQSFLDNNGVITPIVDPLAADGTVVTGINNSGEIVGYYYDANRVAHGFVADVHAGALPVIAGTVAGQEIVDEQTDSLFSNVTISDSNAPTPTESVTVTLSDAANGTLTNLGSGAYDPFAGEYIVTGTAAQVTAALDGLVFAPTIAPGATETTTFTISVDDSLGAPVTDSTTSVTVTSATGPNQTVSIGGAPGYAASLHDTGYGNWDVVNGSNGTVFLTGAQASVVGSGMSIVFDPPYGDTASLYDTNGGWDTVIGGDGAVFLNGAQAALFGGYYNIIFEEYQGNEISLYNTNGNYDQLYASSGIIILSNAQAVVNGGEDTVYFSSDPTNAIAFWGGASAGWDTVTGSFGAITLHYAQASVFGGNDVIYFGNESDDAVSLYQTSGAWDTVWNSNGAVTLNDAQASVLGGNDTIYFNGDAGNAVSLYRTNNIWDNVHGSGGAVTLNNAQTSIFGGGDYVYFSAGQPSAVSLYQTGGVDDFVSGSDGAVTLNDAQAFVSGTGNDIYLNGFTNLVAFQPAFGLETVNGFGYNDVLQFSKADFSDFAALHPVQSGDDTVIALDASDAVTLTGVTASSLTAAQFRFV